VRLSCAVGLNVAADELWNAVSSIVVSERVKLASVETGISRRLAALQRDMQQAIRAADFTPDDYHPPQYQGAGNISQESDLQTQRSSAGFPAVNIEVAYSPYPVTIVAYFVMQAFVNDVAAILSNVNSTSKVNGRLLWRFYRSVISHWQFLYRVCYRRM
jgi:hypothetical protein